ncbi:hypothetical protein M885DRAFT_520681 [Pelagophyceae sp. CCMP2097]|nr:hypothetical protein M885DRAFT_520681 [Pelagophyceae sp. CCMP2097]
MCQGLTPTPQADDAERCAVWDDKAMLHAAVAEMKAAALEDAAEQRRLRAAALLRDDDVDFLLGGGDVCGGGLGVPGDARVHVDNFCVDDGGAPSDGSDEESFCMIPTDSSDEEDAPLRAALKALAPKPAALPTAKRRPPEAASRSQLRPPARPATQDDDGFVPPIPRGFLWEESQVEFTLEPVEAFLLDPDFDYDNVQCTPRLSPEAELEAWKATSPAQTRDGPGDGPDADDDGDVIVVEED